MCTASLPDQGTVDSSCIGIEPSGIYRCSFNACANSAGCASAGASATLASLSESSDVFWSPARPATNQSKSNDLLENDLRSEHGISIADHPMPPAVMAMGHRKLLKGNRRRYAFLDTAQMTAVRNATSAGAQTSQPYVAQGRRMACCNLTGNTMSQHTADQQQQDGLHSWACLAE